MEQESLFDQIDIKIQSSNPNAMLLIKAEMIFQQLDKLPLEEKVDTINRMRLMLSAHSPFNREPVDCVQWIKSEQVVANDYNPNTVAPPEMKLLEHSIVEDGYTQPVVAWAVNSHYEVVDGFHRNRVGKESKKVRNRVLGYLPTVVMSIDRTDRNDRIAATIRHNRARGKHRVEGMSDIVVELKRRNWTNERIGRELGMDEDEILRLCQITGLAELFNDQEFSKSWDVEGEIVESDFKELTDDVSTYNPEETKDFRSVNTSDENRIFHVYTDWECYKAGFYATTKEGMTKEECEKAYHEFLANPERFRDSLEHVISEWKNSCEHYLTNAAMNRIAWLGQAGACYAMGIPAQYRSGFYLLSEEQQKAANEIALTYLNKWLVANNRPEVTMEEAYSGVEGSPRQSDIY